MRRDLSNVYRRRRAIREAGITVTYVALPIIAALVIILLVTSIIRDL